MNGKKICSLLLIAAAAGIMTACSSNGKRATQPGPVISGVQTETVRLESSPQLYQAVGAIHSAHTAILAAQLAGTVREIRVQAGDRVRRGQLLAILDDRVRRRRCRGPRRG